MEFQQTPFPDLVVITPKVWRDDRGYFIETYNERVFRENGLDLHFVQDNLSVSHQGTLRGMHAQAGDHAQGKLVRVARGKVWDIAVDIRKSSSTFGQHFSIELTEENATMLWIPPGFLHGFIALEDNTIFTYKVTGFYDKAGEVGVRWDDPQLAIQWPLPPGQLIISDKDRALPFLKDTDSPFA